MTQQNYSLEIISHHKDFAGKSLKKYNIEGIDTIGVFGNEAFEIKFTNHTSQKIQIALSLDGTNIMTGEPATTEASDKMWVVNGYGTLSLKAFPETDNGGAAFIFTSANNSVAVHTHGDLSTRGIIAAAIFTEGHIEPVRVNPVVRQHHHYYHHYPYYYPTYPYFNSPNWLDWTYQGNYPLTTDNFTCYNNSMSSTVQTCSLNASMDCNDIGDNQASESLETLAGVGAGDYTPQQINYVAGLIKPMFSETVRVRYLWWDNLVEKLKSNNVPVPHASGFPGDKNKQNINLGSTPRIGSYQQPAFPRTQPAAPVYSRV